MPMRRSFNALQCSESSSPAPREALVYSALDSRSTVTSGSAIDVEDLGSR